MDCTKTDNLLMKYMDGSLSTDEKSELEAHLENCKGCEEAFLVYDYMLNSFDKTVYEAPVGFEALVMGQVREIPFQNKTAIIDKLVYLLWGFLSTVFALGFVVAFNAEKILNWMSTSTYFAGYYNAVAPLSETTNTFMLGVYEMALGLLQTLQQLVNAYYPTMVMAVILFIAIQVLLVKRFATKEVTKELSKH